MKCDPNNPTYAHPAPPPKGHVRCATVGDVMKALAAFHPDTPTEGTFGDAVTVTLYNVGLPDEHVEFDDVDGHEDAFDEDDEDDELTTPPRGDHE